MPFGYTSEDWTNPDLESVKEEPLFGLDSSSLQPMNNGFPSMTDDLESSNKAMDAAFDFESAASSPSPLKTDATLPQPRLQKRYKSQMRNSTNSARKSMSPVRIPPLLPLHDYDILFYRNEHGTDIFYFCFTIDFQVRFVFF